MTYRIFGYSTGEQIPEAWEFSLQNGVLSENVDLYAGSVPNELFGARWAGDTDAIDRLMFGVSTDLPATLISSGTPPQEAWELWSNITNMTQKELCSPSMPVQDAIDLARFMAETAARFAHFKAGASTIGGPIEIAAVTKHEGFRWISRKHYFDTSLNGTNQ
ncbi:hypothetical protein JK217_09105 [Gluconobacter kondonii]|uniref:hypothetical protein n=1 Tax=Gluconobacter kondonii TaxID=941463 RepID=UPI001B8B6CE3|nr:hypothetical protein [Gluconobacter kondonii]MBS1077909.1 hypothetical protein [Gluconobacter kondonii]